MLESQVAPRRIKRSMYKTFIGPTIQCGAEAWTFSADISHRLRASERKIIRRIY
jgi:hypothetical protein